MRRLLFLPVLLAALVVGDLSARAFVNTKAEERAELNAPPGASVSTSIDGFPFLPPLLLGGTVSRVGIRLENVAASSALRFATVDVQLRGVELDRSLLLQERRVRITGIESGTVDVEVTQKALTDVLNIPVVIADGALSVELLGRSFSVTPAVSANGRLTLTGAAGRELTLTLPRLDFVPCFGEITVLSGRIRFSCQIDDIPPALVDAVEDAST